MKSLFKERDNPILKRHESMMEMLTKHVKEKMTIKDKLSRSIQSQLISYLNSREHCVEGLIIIIALIDKYSNDPVKIYRCLQIVSFSMKISECFRISARLFLPEFQSIFLISTGHTKNEDRDELFKLTATIIDEITRNTTSKKPSSHQTQIPKPDMSIYSQQFVNPFQSLTPQSHLKKPSYSEEETNFMNETVDLYDPFASERNMLADPITTEKNKSESKYLAHSSRMAPSISSLSDVTYDFFARSLPVKGHNISALLENDDQKFNQNMVDDDDDMFEPIFGSIQPPSIYDAGYIDPIAAVNDMFEEKPYLNNQNSMNNYNLIDFDASSLSDDDFIVSLQRSNEEIINLVDDTPRHLPAFKPIVTRRRPSSMDLNVSEIGLEAENVTDDEGTTHIHLVLDNAHANVDPSIGKKPATLGRFHISRQISAPQGTPLCDLSESDSSERVMPALAPGRLDCQKMALTPP
ncbi:hypothetical protein TRFO_19504 [Tritrichomonas foetus]|uniref:VHS domain-containing protein n=1 Tax=Tritrichomonas foetus TaxID=1144522 RepID=A0A1J4KHZ4_9EUKA|nr:hypothetical protein TRFO_19504 [Tritrichomonas foetus]|eukprot:OHT11009.1 hypothetical protein TRFO_19504 [Tritrichomonas foetus]